jgi:hypothetical protein
MITHESLTYHGRDRWEEAMVFYGILSKSNILGTALQRYGDQLLTVPRGRDAAPLDRYEGFVFWSIVERTREAGELELGDTITMVKPAHERQGA